MTSEDEGRTSASVTATGPAATASPVTVATAPTPATAPRSDGGIGRFMASIIGHLAFAALVVAGVVAYQNYPVLLGNMADTVCADRLLGQYRTTPGSALASRDEPAAAAKTVAAAKTSAAPPTTESAPVAPPAAMAPAHPVGPKAVADTASGVADGAVTPTQGAAITTATNTKPAEKAAATPGPDAAPTEAKASAGNEREPWALPAPAAVKPVASVPQPAAKPEPEQAMAAKLAASPAATTTPAPSAAPVQGPEPKPERAASKSKASADDAKRLAERWQSARSAYHAGKPEAIANYRALVAEFPNVPDLAGELGNIYYNAGWLQDAADQYYEAAQRHIRNGQQGAAACLVGVLKRLNSSLADKLSGQVSLPCPTAPKDTAASNRSG